MSNIEYHPFQPFIFANSKVLMLGAFPPKSNRWSMDFYYPNWINDMWRIMGIIFYNDKNYFCDIPNKTFHLELIKDFLISHNIALYDTAKGVVRLKDNASDKYLSIVETLDLYSMLSFSPEIKTIVTTGEKAASVIAEITDSKIPVMGKYEIIEYCNREIKHFRMPSSSRAYPLSIGKKVDFYRIIFGVL